MPCSSEIADKLQRFPSDWHSPIRLSETIVTGNKRQEKRFQRRLRLFDLPEDLTGKRVLDIGTWDGYFALELERRGADVTAVDIWSEEQYEKFRFVLETTGSKISHRRIDVHDLNPEEMGVFDIVLCAGVLYHCRHPLIALEKIRSVTKGFLILETVTLLPGRHHNAPMIMFFPGDEEAIEKQHEWRIAGAATLSWINYALLSAGFKQVETKYTPSFSILKTMVALISRT